MNKKYQSKVRELEMAFEINIISTDEIVAWADSVIMNDPYDDDVAKLCMISSLSRKEVFNVFNDVGLNSQDWSDEDWCALRVVLGKIYYLLEKEPNRLDSIVSFFHQVSRENHFSLPEYCTFLYSISVDYDMICDGYYAEDSYQCAIYSFVKDLLRELKPFANKDVQQ